MYHQRVEVGIHPNPIGFILALDKRRRENRHVGWIYIMRNRAFRDPLLKIGKTRRPPTQRAAELGAATAVPEGFELIYFVHISDRHEAEAMVHRELAQFRKSSSKEFFTAPLARALAALDRAAAYYPILMRKRPPQALPQLFQTLEVTCRECGTNQRVRQLAVAAVVKCSKCGLALAV